MCSLGCPEAGQEQLQKKKKSQVSLKSKVYKFL